MEDGILRTWNFKLGLELIWEFIFLSLGFWLGWVCQSAISLGFR